MYVSSSPYFPIEIAVHQVFPSSSFLFQFTIYEILRDVWGNRTTGTVELPPGNIFRPRRHHIGSDGRYFGPVFSRHVSSVSQYWKYCPLLEYSVTRNWNNSISAPTLVATGVEIIRKFALFCGFLTACGRFKGDENNRITKAHAALCSMRHLWKRRSISFGLKGTVYNATVCNVLLLSGSILFYSAIHI